MSFTYLFTRQEKLQVTAAAVLVLEGLGSLGTGHPDGPQGEVLLRFKSAVTDWVNNTDEGKAAYSGSSEDLNIGDLLNEDIGNSSQFKELCEKHDVTFVSCEFVGIVRVVPFDTHLVDQSTVDHWWEVYEKRVQHYEKHECMTRSDAQGHVDVLMGKPPGPMSS